MAQSLVQKKSCEGREMHHGLNRAVRMDPSIEIGCYAILAFDQVIAWYLLLLCFCNAILFIVEVVFHKVMGFQC